MLLIDFSSAEPLKTEINQLVHMNSRMQSQSWAEGDKLAGLQRRKIYPPTFVAKFTVDTTVQEKRTNNYRRLVTMSGITLVIFSSDSTTICLIGNAHMCGYGECKSLESVISESITVMFQMLYD